MPLSMPNMLGPILSLGVKQPKLSSEAKQPKLYTGLRPAPHAGEKVRHGNTYVMSSEMYKSLRFGNDICKEHYDSDEEILAYLQTQAKNIAYFRVKEA